jgi:ferredoxin--NADP+ reductase
MCGGCRVVLDDGAQFACVDGPEFDGHKVDWDILLSRLAFYKAQEQEALQRWEALHTQEDTECLVEVTAQ